MIPIGTVRDMATMKTQQTPVQSKLCERTENQSDDVRPNRHLRVPDLDDDDTEDEHDT